MIGIILVLIVYHLVKYAIYKYYNHQLYKRARSIVSQKYERVYNYKYELQHLPESLIEEISTMDVRLMQAGMVE